MKICPKCGAHIPDDAQFCTSCGAALQQQITARDNYMPFYDHTA